MSLLIEIILGCCISSEELEPRGLNLERKTLRTSVEGKSRFSWRAVLGESVALHWPGCVWYSPAIWRVIVFRSCGGCYWPRIFLLSVRIQLPFPPNSKLILLISMTKYSIYPQGFYTKFPLWVDLSVDYSVTVSASDCFNYCSFLIFSSLWKLSKILMVFVSMDVLESACQCLPKFCCDSGWGISLVMSLGYGGNWFFCYVRMPHPGKWCLFTSSGLHLCSLIKFFPLIKFFYFYVISTLLCSY